MKKKMAALLLAFGVLAGCAPQGQQEPCIFGDRFWYGA